MAAASSDSVIMTYKMLGVNNKEVLATALVFTPPASVLAPVSGWPIVVWAHGTTGVADKCAPSQQGLGGNEVLLKALLKSGYVVVAPDYEGLGEPSGLDAHPFLNVKSEAYSITDAVVAARSYLSSQGKMTSRQWMTVGHSQGGQAALGAAQYASRAKLDYKGTIAVAPASNLGAILTNGELSVKDAPVNFQIPVYAQLDTFTALITAGLRNNNLTFSYSNVFKSPTDLIASKAESNCSGALGNEFVSGMQNYLKTNVDLKNYPRTQTNFMALPLVKEFLEKDSQPAQVKLNQPVVIYQGAKDTTVPKEATDALVFDAANKGSTIRYVTNPEWDHGTAYVLNIENIVNDVKSVMPASN